jgi:hypothetical protein
MASYGRRGWLWRDGGWVACDLLEQNEAQLKIKINDKIEIVDASNAKFCPRNPDDVEAVDDFLQLPFLDEPNILQSLVCKPLCN